MHPGAGDDGIIRGKVKYIFRKISKNFHRKYKNDGANTRRREYVKNIFW